MIAYDCLKKKYFVLFGLIIKVESVMLLKKKFQRKEKAMEVLKKSIFSYVIVLILMLSGTPIVAMAEEKPSEAIIEASEESFIEDGPNGDSLTDLHTPISIESQLDEIEAMNDGVKKQAFMDKYNFYLAMKNKQDSPKDSKALLRTLSASGSGMLTVMVCKQETSYYCGPATCQQVLNYVGSSGWTQQEIARKIGTTKDGSNLPDMRTFLNNNQGRTAYLITTRPTMEDLKSAVAYDVLVAGTPSVARLKITKGGSWLYSSNGHYLNVAGYSNSGETMRIVDPYIQWIQPSHSGVYNITCTELYSATNNHPNKQFMW